MKFESNVNFGLSKSDANLNKALKNVLSEKEILKNKEADIKTVIEEFQKGNIKLQDALTKLKDIGVESDFPKVDGKIVFVYNGIKYTMEAEKSDKKTDEKYTESTPKASGVKSTPKTSSKSAFSFSSKSAGKSVQNNINNLGSSNTKVQNWNVTRLSYNNGYILRYTNKFTGYNIKDEYYSNNKLVQVDTYTTDTLEKNNKVVNYISNSKNYNSNGNLIHEKNYYSTGIISDETIYDTAHNAAKTVKQYDELGRVTVETYYNGDVQTGSQCYYYNENGLHYKDTFNPEGQKITSVDYQHVYNSEAAILTAEYGTNGEKTKETITVDNKLVETIEYNSNGGSHVTYYDKDTSKRVSNATYDPDGSLRYETFYDENGNVTKDINYKYTYNGKSAKCTTEYNVDKYDGKVTINVNGKNKVITYYDMENGYPKIKKQSIRMSNDRYQTHYIDDDGKVIDEEANMEYGNGKLKYDIIKTIGNSANATAALLLLKDVFGEKVGGALTAQMLWISMTGNSPVNATKGSVNSLNAEDKAYWTEILNNNHDTTEIGYTADDISIYTFNKNSLLSERIKQNSAFKAKIKQMIKDNVTSGAINSGKDWNDVDLAHSIGKLTIRNVSKKANGKYEVKYSDIYDFPQSGPYTGGNIGGLNDMGAILQRLGYSKPFAIQGTIEYSAAELGISNSNGTATLYGNKTDNNNQSISPENKVNKGEDQLEPPKDNIFNFDRKRFV